MRQRSRRLSRVTLAVTGVALMLIGLGIFLAPLPLTWIFNAWARGFESGGLQLRARAESVSFCWQLGRKTARLKVTGLTGNIRGRPLASFEWIHVEINKPAARRGRWVPERVIGGEGRGLAHPGSFSLSPAGRNRVELHGGVAEFALAESRDRIDIPRLVIDTTAGRIRGTDISLQAVFNGEKIRGRVEVDGGNVAELARFAPALLPVLRDAGIGIGDVNAGHSRVNFSLTTERTATGGRRAIEGAVTAEFEPTLLGRPLQLKTTVQLGRNEREINMHLSVRPFEPAVFGARPLFGVNCAGLQFPVHLEAEAQLDAETWGVSTLSTRLRAGPGRIGLAALDSPLPFRAVLLDAEWDSKKQRVTLPLARVELAPEIVAGIENGALIMDPWRFEGRASFRPLQLTDALAWWPEQLQPQLRQAAVAAEPTGRLETRGYEFALEQTLPQGAWRLNRGAGEISLQQLALRVPGVPDRVKASRITLRAESANAGVQVENARMPGLAISTAGIELANLQSTPEVRAQMSFTGIPGEMNDWMRRMDVPAPLLTAMQQSAPLQGKLNARVAGTWGNFTETDVELNLKSEKLHVPAIVAGALTANLRFLAPNPSSGEFRATFALADPKLAGRNPGALFSPLSIHAHVRDWRSPSKAAFEGQASADAFFGLPFRLETAITRSADGAVLREDFPHRLMLGRTGVSLEWKTEKDRSHLRLDANRIDLGEIARTAAPWMALVPIRDRPTSILAGNSARSATPSNPIRPISTPPMRRVELSAAAKTIDFGSERRLQDLKLSATLLGEWPERLRLTAKEGSGHKVSAEVQTKESAQRVDLALDDTGGLFQTLFEPLRVLQVPPAVLPQALQNALKIPEILAGGSLTVQGELSHRPEGVTARGRLQLENATLLRPPRILQGLAAVSGNHLGNKPRIRKLLLGEWSLDPKGIEIKHVSLDGSGLIDRLKLSSVKYSFANEAVGINGHYFKVGFKIVGTRADPQFYVEDTAFLRSFLLQRDSGFFDDQPVRPPAR